MLGVRLAETPGQRTPVQGPRFTPFCDILDFSPRLDGQTTFKSDKTNAITTVSKRASEQHKNHLDTMLALQEPFRKPRKTRQKATSTRRNDTRRTPPGGLGHGRSANGRPPLE